MKQVYCNNLKFYHRHEKSVANIMRTYSSIIESIKVISSGIGDTYVIFTSNELPIAMTEEFNSNRIDFTLEWSESSGDSGKIWSSFGEIYKISIDNNKEE